MSGVNQAVAALSPSLINYIGNNPALALGNAVYKMSNDYLDRSYKDASLKLAEGEAADKAQYYRDMAETKRMAIEQKAKDIAAEQAKAEANITAAKALYPDNYRKFIEAQGGAGSYLDPTKEQSLNRGLAYVKLDDMKGSQDKEAKPQLITNQGGQGVWAYPDGTTKPANTTIYKAPVFSPMDYTNAKLNFESEKPTVQATGKDKARLGDAFKKLGLDPSAYQPIANAEMAGYSEAEKSAAGISFYPGIGYLRKVK